MWVAELWEKKHLLSVCLVYYSFISSHSQAVQSSFMNLAPLTFSFMTWNCPFFIFTQRTCYYTYIWITVYKDTFLLCIFITVVGVQISLLGGTAFVQLARSVLTGEWEMFSSADGVCWVLFLKSHGRHRSQRPPPLTPLNTAIIIWPYLYRITDINVSLKIPKFYLIIQRGHGVVRDDHSQWCVAGVRDLQEIKTQFVLYSFSRVFSHSSNLHFILLICFGTLMFLSHTGIN